MSTVHIIRQDRVSSLPAFNGESLDDLYTEVIESYLSHGWNRVIEVDSHSILSRELDDDIIIWKQPLAA